MKVIGKLFLVLILNLQNYIDARIGIGIIDIVLLVIRKVHGKPVFCEVSQSVN